MSRMLRCSLFTQLQSSVVKNDVRSFNKHLIPTLSACATTRGMNWQSRHWNHSFRTQLYNDDLYAPNRVPIRSTTIICVRKGDDVVLMGDGQMTIGSVVAKHNAKKLRKLSGGKVIAGFAGAAADGIALIDLLEKKLSERDELRRACVETTRLWRTDKILRRLEALIIVADEKSTFELTGNGELVESETGIIAIGSGGHFAEAAARALIDTNLTADEIAAKSMKIAADMCVYTNGHISKLKLVKGKGIVEDTIDSKN
ncbi:ATP-dependent protease hslV [Reticulomyxa filosa]|uniref:ATP-dependent protease hslV n=1 Tax=Reticulomyxa filosa TaxID=46433 RepID=X6NLG9_RETFI|nr:ATP-dependent protease hslV [Reticulomyxa filosa]|eukprot:ETO26227.1 ATP-dependent protease hslV [Reticulomyxa filosa]